MFLHIYYNKHTQKHTHTHTVRVVPFIVIIVVQESFG